MARRINLLLNVGCRDNQSSSSRCWVLLGIGLVLFIWRRQSVAGGREQIRLTKQAQENAENLEKLYNFLLGHSEGATMQEVIQALLVEESQAVQYLGQLEARGIVRQFRDENGDNSFALNKDSEFNLF